MPAKNIPELKRQRQAVVAQMRALLDTAETRSDKKLTGEEETKYNELRGQVDRMTADIEREEQLQALEAGNAQQRHSGPNEIREFGEFLAEVRFNPNNLESRDVTMGNGPSMGFLVPDQFDREIRAIDPQGAIVRPRASVIPAGEQPDAAIQLTALDQSNALGVYSGVTVQWIAENGARPDAGDPRVRLIRIEPQQVVGYIDVSDKMLRNSAACGAWVQKLLKGAINGAEDAAFWRGTGVGQPLGVIGHPSSINVARAGAGAIAYADVVGMFARAKFGGSYAWIANQTCLPQLMTMVDAGNNLVWQPNAREGNPGTLLGFPVLLNERSSVLGTQGDLALVDLSYYAIKDGSPLAIQMDPYTQKVNGVTRIYAFWNVDGQPMLTTPMLQEDGVSTVSPFVVLQ